MSRELASQLGEKGIKMLDATISGTSVRCCQRDVTMMIGGIEEVFNQCKDILGSLAKEIYFIGANGAEALTKLTVNLVLLADRMALAEGLSQSGKAGLDQIKF